MSERKHNRSYCLDCGRKLNGREWLYGACSACIKKRGKANGWRPHGNAGTPETGWFYVDNAPRWAEYGDPQDMDTEGVVKLMEVVFGGMHFYANRNKPELPDEYKPLVIPKPVKKPTKCKIEAPKGMKKCRSCDTLLPVGGPTQCPECARVNAARIAAYRQKRREANCCIQCGKPLPKGAKSSKCEACRVHNRKYWMKYQEAKA